MPEVAWRTSLPPAVAASPATSGCAKNRKVGQPSRQTLLRPIVRVEIKIDRFHRLEMPVSAPVALLISTSPLTSWSPSMGCRITRASERSQCRDTFSDMRAGDPGSCTPYLMCS